MEEKPVTDLVLLPSLELIPTESLPKHRTKELALLETNRAHALWELNKNIAFTFGLIISTGLSAVGFLWNLIQMSYGPVILLAMLYLLLAVLSTRKWKESAQQMRAWRKLDASRQQLQLDVKEEEVLSIVWKKTNEDIVNWNMVVEVVKQDNSAEFDLPPLNLEPLKKSREEISARRELFIKVANVAANKTDKGDK